MIPEIGAWGINHTLNFNPNPGGNNCMTCSCSLPHVCRENVQASSSNHPDVSGTDALAENLCGYGPWAVLPCPLEQEIPSELFCEWWDDMWKTALLLPTLYLCKHLWQAGSHLGSSKLKSKQTKITLCLWVNIWGVILDLCTSGTMCQISLLTWLYLLTLNLTLEVTLEE